MILTMKFHSNVPCNGCTWCCGGDAVRLLPEDDIESFETEPHPYFEGELMLSHKSNGACVYLVEGGCSIHHRRPKMCYEMDCRNIAKAFTFTQARKMKGLPINVWKKGKQLLKDMP